MLFLKGVLSLSELWIDVVVAEECPLLDVVTELLEFFNNLAILEFEIFGGDGDVTSCGIGWISTLVSNTSTEAWDSIWDESINRV